jgi:hypothetical protein
LREAKDSSLADSLAEARRFYTEDVVLAGRNGLQDSLAEARRFFFTAE